MNKKSKIPAPVIFLLLFPTTTYTISRLTKNRTFENSIENKIMNCSNGADLTTFTLNKNGEFKFLIDGFDVWGKYSKSINGEKSSVEFTGEHVYTTAGELDGVSKEKPLKWKMDLDFSNEKAKINSEMVKISFSKDKKSVEARVNNGEFRTFENCTEE